jgi:hypothetical protein
VSYRSWVLFLLCGNQNAGTRAPASNSTKPAADRANPRAIRFPFPVRFFITLISSVCRTDRTDQTDRLSLPPVHPASLGSFRRRPEAMADTSQGKLFTDY